jgi:Sec-independent protein translocase protein TatA
MFPGVPQVGGPELLILLVILLLLFGAKMFSSKAGELGRLVKGAQSTVEDVKSEFVPEIDEARRTVEGLKSEVVSGAQRDERCHKP